MRIFWFSVPAPSGNFGDDAIRLGVKDIFASRFGDIEWIEYPVRYQTTAELFRTVNSCDLALVGPGGLVLPDAVPDSVSGWQFNIHEKHIKKFQVPLVVLAIGWNLFHGQELTTRAKDSLRVLAEKADVFTARNTGSVERLTDIGVKGVEVCPCPTLFIETAPGKTVDMGVPMIGVNLAGDRPHLRFNDRGFFADQVRHFCAAMNDRGAVVTFINHSYSSVKNCQDIQDTIRTAGVRRIETNFPQFPDLLRDRVRSYRDFDLVVGMRGHGCMIPFGQGVPVIAWATHDKVRWFMEDAIMKDLVVEANLVADDRLNALALEALHEKDWYQSRVAASLQRMREQLEKTMGRIGGLVS